jgi:serine/threonine-protein kinase
MASVHLGRAAGDPARPIAIKLLHPHLLERPEIVSMFLDEARIAAGIRHAHVVRVDEVEAIGDELLIAMDFVEGGSLKQVLAASARAGEWLESAFAATVVHQALLGLEAAHAVNVVHRDVSPHNLLIGTDGLTRVVDFGVAKAKGRLSETSTGNVKGKIGYLAPEQARALPLDRRTDVFAAGIVLWESLTQRSLFGGGTDAEALDALMQRSIEPPSAHAPGISIALDRVCLRALERDPERRHPTAAAFACALAEAMRGRFESEEQIGARVERLLRHELEALRRALRARARSALPIGAIALAVAGAMVAASWIGRSDAPPAERDRTLEAPPSEVATERAEERAEAATKAEPAIARPIARPIARRSPRKPLPTRPTAPTVEIAPKVPASPRAAASPGSPSADPEDGAPIYIPRSL